MICIVAFTRLSRTRNLHPKSAFSLPYSFSFQGEGTRMFGRNLNWLEMLRAAVCVERLRANGKSRSPSTAAYKKSEL